MRFLFLSSQIRPRFPAEGQSCLAYLAYFYSGSRQLHVSMFSDIECRDMRAEMLWLQWIHSLYICHSLNNTGSQTCCHGLWGICPSRAQMTSGKSRCLTFMRHVNICSLEVPGPRVIHISPHNSTPRGAIAVLYVLVSSPEALIMSGWFSCIGPRHIPSSQWEVYLGRLTLSLLYAEIRLKAPILLPHQPWYTKSSHGQNNPGCAAIHPLAAFWWISQKHFLDSMRYKTQTNE